jgi:uncharacterized membrane protein
MSSRTAARLVVAFAAGGLATSTYLTIAHYTSPTVLACSSRGLVNCEQVTTSAQSTFLGIPVAVLGVLWFAMMLVISTPGRWDVPVLHRVRIIGAVVGIAFAIWLVYAELAIIGAICLWCSITHVFAFGVLMVVLIEASWQPAATGE